MSHLTASQRYAISVMRQSNYTQKAIALAIGKDKSVISRELKRNSDGRTGEYKSDLAERKCRERHKRKRKSSKFTAPMQDRVETLLREDYSPEQVVGFLKQEGTACVSHERIYQHIWADKKRGGNLYKHLRTKGKRYRKRGAAKDKRGTICNKVSIEERPDIVEEKSRFGDLEIDTVIGKNHQGAIVTINDRATGMLKMKKIQKKEAALVKEAALELLQEWKPLIHTITSDNGKEFALHQDIAKELGIQFYFAHPYHSWERGANENLNGLIRQYIPKKTNFADISDQFIADIQDKLNNRPRKRLNFKSPNQTFLKVAFIT
jgi:IS30 family transposase